MIVNIMNILITTASEISSEKLILFLLKNKEYNIKCTELSKFKESCNKDLDIAFNNLEDSKNINFLIDKSDILIHFTRSGFLTDNNSLNMYLRNTYNLLFSAIQKGVKKIIFISDLDIFNEIKLSILGKPPNNPFSNLGFMLTIFRLKTSPG